MYLYLRADLGTDVLPEALLKRTGTLSAVMDLSLTPDRKLARVEVGKVIEQLRGVGYFLQMPPPDAVHGHLHFGD